MILYPTETLYALGVNALDGDALAKLYRLKEREAGKQASWLVRNMDDIAKYAVIPKKAVKIAERFLPGRLTLVLQALPHIGKELTAEDGTIGFRVSSDLMAQKVIEEYMAEHASPLTCTSANISGLSTLSTIGEILQQFGARAKMITKIVDDGPRKGLASTIVRVVGDDVTILREGDISEAEILQALE